MPPHASAPIALVLLALALPQLGCAFATTSEAMIPVQLPALRPGDRSVNLQTRGGRATHLWGKSQISNRAFNEALAHSLVRANLLWPLIDRVADYQLEATLVELQQPSFSLATRVDIGVAWRLWHTETRRVVWDERIRTSDTASLSEALIGTKRCRLATERAARANIREAIERMSRLDLAPALAPPRAETSPARPAALLRAVPSRRR